ncbi:MAG: ThiF family adenylyltransferase, partial [Pseudomonadota bacterium]
DNFATRHAINRVCFNNKKMLVSGAAIRFDGQLSSFDFRTNDAPCYSCLFPEDTDVTEERCAVMGVFAPLVGVIGTMQAAEAIHLLTNIDHSRIGNGAKLSMFDARTMSWHEVRYRKDPACDVCGQSHRVRHHTTEVAHA